MTTAYNEIVKKGGTAFDIGAYTGSRTDALLALGCKRVVAVEAAAEYYYRLRQKYESDNRVVVLWMAAGPQCGTGILNVHKVYWPGGERMDSALSTMSEEWITRVDKNAKWNVPAAQWSEKQSVTVITLDALIKTFGEPDFIKIDVEGYEQEVIKGLTHPVKALSFEFHTTLHLDWSEHVVGHLLTLGSYEFNYDLEDRLELVSPVWLSREQLFDKLQGQDIYGDIFARRTC
jgi:FkbM family methyltransferase